MTDRSRAIMLVLVLAGCKGLTPINPGAVDTDASDTDGSVDGEAPVVAPLDPYRNEDKVVVTGTASQPKVRLSWTGPDGDGSRELPVVSGGFEYTITIGRGAPTTFVAHGIDGSEETGPSAAVATEACDPPDSFEIEAYYGAGYGDSCEEEPIYTNAPLPDNGAVQTFLGNLHAPDDVDWIRVTATDSAGDEARGYEDFKLAARFVQGEGTFEMTVFRGGCADDLAECPGEAYDTYSWAMEDLEPDELGSVPEDPRACGAPPFNECLELGAEYYILVQRKDAGFDCTPYEVEVTNGAW